MTENTPHARAFDLPGWPCPPRVRDIASHENSWGYVPCHGGLGSSSADSPGFPKIVQDELGRLWADGDTIPKFKTLNGGDDGPGAILFWTEQGMGVYVHPKSLRYIGDLSRLEMQPDRWIPIAVAAAEMPAFVKAAQ